LHFQTPINDRKRWNISTTRTRIRIATYLRFTVSRRQMTSVRRQRLIATAARILTPRRSAADHVTHGWIDIRRVHASVVSARLLTLTPSSRRTRGGLPAAGAACLPACMPSEFVAIPRQNRKNTYTSRNLSGAAIARIVDITAAAAGN
jgi:hypothetical protein